MIYHDILMYDDVNDKVIVARFVPLGRSRFDFGRPGCGLPPRER